MSAWKPFRRTMTYVEQYERLHKAGAINVLPPWFDACKAHPPPGRDFVTTPAVKIVFPEDHLMRKYYKRNPLAKTTEVLDLQDETRKVPAVVFVTRQLELMEKHGLKEDAAYAQTNAEMRPGATGDTASKAQDEQAQERAKEAAAAQAKQVEAPSAPSTQMSGSSWRTGRRAPSQPARPKVADSEELISLRNQFTDWTRAEEDFWIKQARVQKDRRNDRSKTHK